MIPMKENQRIQKFKMYQIMKQISKMNQKLRTKVEKMPKIMKKISKINRKLKMQTNLILKDKSQQNLMLDYLSIFLFLSNINKYF